MIQKKEENRRALLEMCSQQTENTSNGKDVINWKTFKEDWRHFNIDLSPKVLFCRGPLVDLLISSQVSRYLEFRAVSRVLTYMDGVFQEVPSSRADVFNSQIVNIRMLMKFLTFCLELDNHQAEYEGSRPASQLRSAIASVRCRFQNEAVY
eukprot:m.191832 g.191832  ORF g.191832 m.191832 type:complete len:151 (+) comp39453_c0_seq50:757-1209(+)